MCQTTEQMGVDLSDKERPMANTEMDVSDKGRPMASTKMNLN